MVATSTRIHDRVPWFGTVNQFTTILEVLETALSDLANEEHDEEIARLQKQLDENKSTLEGATEQTDKYDKEMLAYSVRDTRMRLDSAKRDRDDASKLHLVATRPGVKDKISGSADDLKKWISSEPYDTLTVTSYGMGLSTQNVELQASRHSGLSASIASGNRRWSIATLKELEDKVKRGTPWFGRQLTNSRWVLGALISLGAVAFIIATLTSDAMRGLMSSLIALPVGFIALFAVFVILPASVIARSVTRRLPLFALDLGAETPYRDRLPTRVLTLSVAALVNVALAFAPALIFPSQ